MGEIGVIPALEDFLDRILGRGDAAITVPTFDGSLKPNQLLEKADPNFVQYDRRWGKSA